MAHDIMSQFYTCLNYPLHDKLTALTRIIDQSSANKDLQALFPQLINNIFASSFSNGWGLRTVTCDTSRYEYELLISFLEPQGPMLRLCYKLLSDSQLKYNLPLNVLPIDLQLNLERGRSCQFYCDMLTTDTNSLNVVALALNPFDFYMFNFALHLVSYSQNKSSWENWNSAYFALACDYLMHFLPSDPNVPVLPHVPNYTGKAHMAAPLQTANRPFSQNTPSLLIIPNLPGINNQNTPPQNQSRNEVWRSETVLQVFIDIWMCVEQFNARSVEMYQRNYAIANSSPERVRTVRVLVKHIHSFSAKHQSDTASRSSALRKYARQIMCARAYHYIKHLVTTWPLDASFRLVMELWLSLIQPWRYMDNTITQDRFPNSNNNQEDGSITSLDPNFIQFIAENYPAYTCIFKLVLPRFMMLDLTSYKNAVMLFRLGKVFSQQQLVAVLKGLEKAITLNNSGFYSSPDTSSNSTELEQSFTYNGMVLQKWVAVAKQAVSELNLATNFEYEPIWSENKKQSSIEFVKKIISAKLSSQKNLEELNKKINQQHQGVLAGIKRWLMLGGTVEEEQALEECKKVPNYLNASMNFFVDIFGLQEASLIIPLDPVVEEISEHSSFANSTQFPLSITNKLRNKSNSIHYMGDPDLMPITTYESTILVRMLHQIATRLNEVYQDEFTNLWNRNDFWGFVAREVLQKPCTIHTYMRDATNHQNIVGQNLPARLSLRRLGSYAIVVWVIIGYIIMRTFCSYGGLFYTFLLFIMWTLLVLTKASCKMLRIMSM